MAMPVRKKPAPGTPSDPTTSATQTTMYIMPVITFIFALSFPSGLALYWTVGAIFASVQQYFLAGWGSLFLGIPGMEHLVPPPKEIPGTVSAVGGAGVARGAGARSLVAPPRSTVASPPERSGGIRGFFRQMRDLADQQAQSQEAARAARGSTSADKTTVVDAVPASEKQQDNNVNGARKVDTGVSGTGGGASQASRRYRSTANNKPVFVPTKPATNTDLPPEKAIQRDATGPVDDVATSPEKRSNPLPENAISRAAKSNGRGTSSGSSSSSSSSQSTAVPRPALGTKNASNNGNNGSGSRRSNGSSGKRSSSSSRNRSTNRSKGGR